jgi:hypothetical protein
VERTREALGELMSCQLGNVRLAVMMIDRVELTARRSDEPSRGRVLIGRATSGP